MQEELTQKTIAFVIKTVSLSTAGLEKVIKAYLDSQGKGRASKPKTRTEYKGKQTLRQLQKQHAALSSIDVAVENIKGFEKTARKYNIEYALMKDKTVDPPVYVVYFKGKDADSMNAAFREFTTRVVRMDERTPVSEQLENAREEAARNDSPEVRPRRRHRKRQRVKNRVKMPERIR